LLYQNEKYTIPEAFHNVIIMTITW